jgi:hypothetical protein
MLSDEIKCFMCFCIKQCKNSSICIICLTMICKDCESDWDKVCNKCIDKSCIVAQNPNCDGTCAYCSFIDSSGSGFSFASYDQE